jgi:hypothetical protein
MRIRFNLFRNLQEFDHIEPALTIFVLGNEGLRAVKAISQFLLRQPGGFPCLDELRYEGPVSRGMN